MSEMTPAAQAAAELVEGAARLVEAPPEGEQPETQETPPEAPSMEADLTGIEDLLEPDPEPEEEYVETDDDEPVDEYDPNQLQRKIKQLEKKNKWLDEQRVKQGIPNWRSEAKQRFPYAASLVDQIEGTSRRAILREAHRLHTLVETATAPMRQSQQAAQTQQEQTQREAERAQEAREWGTPTAGPAQPLIEPADADQLDRRKHSSVRDMVTARFRHDPRFKDGI